MTTPCGEYAVLVAGLENETTFTVSRVGDIIPSSDNPQLRCFVCDNRTVACPRRHFLGLNFNTYHAACVSAGWFPKESVSVASPAWNKVVVPACMQHLPNLQILAALASSGILSVAMVAKATRVTQESFKRFEDKVRPAARQLERQRWYQRSVNIWVGNEWCLTKSLGRTPTHEETACAAFACWQKEQPGWSMTDWYDAARVVAQSFEF